MSVEEIQIRAVAERFRKDRDDNALGILRVVRKEAASYLVNQQDADAALAWRTGVRKLRSLLKDAGLMEAARDAEEEDLAKSILEKLRVHHADAWPGGAVAAGMVLCRNWELPLPQRFSSLPEWLRWDYADYLLESPDLFSGEGDAASYAYYLLGVVELYHRAVTGRACESASKLAGIFSERASFIQAYFNGGNLRRLYAMRGDIIAATLARSGCRSLTAFPPRLIRRDRIRLGVFAGDFLARTETYFTLAHLEGLDRSRFEIILYCLTTAGDFLEQRCRSHADQVVALNFNDTVVQWAQRVRDDDLDIILLTTNMTAVISPATLLGTFRLARIQVATVSSPVTTGLNAVDVMLSAQWNEPEADAQSHFTEYLHLLPGSINYYCYQYDRQPATVEISRARLGIKDEQIVFFSGANYFKILPELSAVWADILAAVPGSVLLLMPFNPNWSKNYQTRLFTARILRQFAQRGVAGDRLQVLSAVPTRADVHRVLALGDIYLDAYPFAGACSMLDPLIVGVPPVAWRGAVGRSTHGASSLRIVGLERLAAQSAQEYAALAIELATNSAKRGEIRRYLTDMNATPVPPYFDTVSFSRRVGTALEDLHSRYRKHYEVMSQRDVSFVKQSLQQLADEFAGKHVQLDALIDIGIVNELVVPFFRGLSESEPALRHMLDVGACHGEMALPLLRQGWTADLFEPDPACTPVMQNNLKPHLDRVRTFALAVGDRSAAEVVFHRNLSQGLSGLAASPFGKPIDTIRVPMVRLADFCVDQGVRRVDFLKIDAEGYDFEILEGHDFLRLPPRLALVEYGTHFPRQTVAIVNEAVRRMEQRGFGAIIFNYTDDGAFSKGQWSYRLTDIHVDRRIPPDRSPAFGNILFYRSDDKAFLLALMALLDCGQPREWLSNGN